MIERDFHMGAVAGIDFAFPVSLLRHQNPPVLFYMEDPSCIHSKAALQKWQEFNSITTSHQKLPTSGNSFHIHEL